MNKLTSFTVDDRPVPVVFVETMDVKEGVVCDVYKIEGDDTRDLAIVTVRKGCKTPLQRVVAGKETREGFVSGQGVLTVWSAAGVAAEHRFGSDTKAGSVVVSVNERMQWHADSETDLVFSEVCTPPYEDGRFENITD